MGSRGKPANAKNAYNFFTSIMHEEFKSLFPGKTVDFIDFQRRCAGKWKLLTPEEKVPFEQMTALDKQRFQEEVKNFPSVKEVGKEKKKKKIKDPNEPKRPLSAFFLFSNEKRMSVKAENPDFSVGEIGRKLGEMWRNLSEESKRPYEDAAKRAKERYVKAMEAFKEGRPFEAEEEEAVPESVGGKSIDNFENLDVLLNESLVPDESLVAQPEEEMSGLSIAEFENLDKLLEDSLMADEDAASKESGETGTSVNSVGPDAQAKDAASAQVETTPERENLNPGQVSNTSKMDELSLAATQSANHYKTQPESKLSRTNEGLMSSVENNKTPSDPIDSAVSTESPCDVAKNGDRDVKNDSEPVPGTFQAVVGVCEDFEVAASDDGKCSRPAEETVDIGSKVVMGDDDPVSSQSLRGARESGNAFKRLEECLNDDSDFDGFDQLDELL